MQLVSSEQPSKAGSARYVEGWGAKLMLDLAHELVAI